MNVYMLFNDKKQLIFIFTIFIKSQMQIMNAYKA